MALCYSPDGKVLASAGIDGGLALWDLDTHQVRWTLNGPLVGPLGLRKGFSALAFSVDGAKLAALTESNVFCWDTSTGKQLANLAPQSQLLRGLAFSGNGKSLITAGGPQQTQGDDVGEVVLWDTSSWKKVTTWRKHRGPIDHLSLAADGETVATSAEGDDEVRVWNVHTGKEQLARRTTVGKPDVQVLLSPDRRLLGVAPGGSLSNVEIYECATKELKTTLGLSNAMPGRMNAIAFSPDSSLLLAVGQNGNWREFVLKIWDMRTFQLRAYIDRESLSKGVGHPNTLAFSPDGKTVAFGSSGGGDIMLVQLADLLAQGIAKPK